MNNQITEYQFNNQFNSQTIRTLLNDAGEVWFVAKDVAEALDYVWQSNLIKHVPSEWKGVNRITTLGGDQEMSILSEQGLYFFLGRSDKAAALPMQKWIAGEVLPSIRKTGSYSLKPLSALELAKQQVILLEQLEETQKQLTTAIATKAEIGSRREATAMNRASQASKKAKKAAKVARQAINVASHAVDRVKALEVELDQSKSHSTIKRAEMLCRTKFNWRLLKSACKDLGIDAIDVYDPNFDTVKAYPAEAWKKAYNLDIDAFTIH